MITSQLLECPDPRSSLTPSLAYFLGPCGSGEEERVSASLHHRLTARQRSSSPDSIANLSPTSKLPPVNRSKHKALNQIKSLISVKFNVKRDRLPLRVGESLRDIAFASTSGRSVLSSQLTNVHLKPSPQVPQSWNMDAGLIPPLSMERFQSGDPADQPKNRKTQCMTLKRQSSWVIHFTLVGRNSTAG